MHKQEVDPSSAEPSRETAATDSTLLLKSKVTKIAVSCFCLCVCFALFFLFFKKKMCEYLEWFSVHGN